MRNLVCSLLCSWLLFLLFQIYYWKAQSSSKRNRRHIEKKILTFQGSKTHGMLPGLEPFSHYTVNVRVVNGKGEGPASPDRVFNTPEGGMGWTRLWDPRNTWHIWRGFAWQKDPQIKYILEAKCNFPIDEHSWQNASSYVALRICGSLQNPNAALKPPSQLKIFLHT